MGKATVGVKAGIVSGVVYGAVTALTTYLTLFFMREQTIAIIASYLTPNSPVTAEQAYRSALVTGPISAIIIGIVLGLVVGAIYGSIYERIPGGTAVPKGILLSIGVWLIFCALEFTLGIEITPTSAVVGFGKIGYGAEYYAVSFTSGLVAWLIYGVLLGTFYNRFASAVSA